MFLKGCRLPFRGCSRPLFSLEWESCTHLFWVLGESGEGWECLDDPQATWQPASPVRHERAAWLDNRSLPQALWIIPVNSN